MLLGNQLNDNETACRLLCCHGNDNEREVDFPLHLFVFQFFWLRNTDAETK